MKSGNIVLVSFIMIMLLACLPNSSIGYRHIVEPEIGPNQVPISEAFYFSTYLGGDPRYSDDDRGASACVGPDGTIYSLIYSETPSWPMVDAYYDTYRGGESDIVLVRMSADGTEYLYSTFLGGDGRDFPNKMEIDNQGNVYIVGSTLSTNFATPGAYDETHNGNDDVFIMKFNPHTNTRHYATYIGGSDKEHATSLVVDSSGQVYVTGITQSNDFPIVNGIDGVFDGGSEAFILKLNADGTELLFSTYIGGSGADRGSDIALGVDGDVCITGETGSADFYCTDGTFDTTLDGPNDGFITKIESDGSEIIYSSLIGGMGTDSGLCCIFDDAGNLYVTGITHSPDFPTSTAAYDDSLNGGLDVFLLEMNEQGSALLHSTYIGGIEDDVPRGICFDDWGFVVIQGVTNSDDFPMANAFDEDMDGEVLEGIEAYIDCFVLKIDIISNRLHYSTYLGGSQNEDAGWIDFDNNGNIIICGMTTSEDFPVTNGTLQEEFYYEWDAFVVAVYDRGDMDGDGLYEFQETAAGTNHTNSDSDSDTLPDGWEFHNDLNPLDDDSLDDNDFDELTNLEEYQHGTDPWNPDSDSDSFPDGWEVANGYPPNDSNAPITELLLYNFPLIGAGSITAAAVLIVYFFRPKPRLVSEEQVRIEAEEAEEARRVLKELTEDLQSESGSEAVNHETSISEGTDEGVDEE